jgi:ribosomal protein S18 acetylase RimI-like enzyme
MTDLDPPFRIATPEDAPALAELVNAAGHGMPLYLWTTWAEAGQDPWEIGRNRQAKKAADGRIIVADRGNGAVAQLTGYIAEPEIIGDDTPEMFVPLIELENEVPGSWYVNVLATMPEARGQGLGAALLNIAERLGRAATCKRMSVIVASDNPGARRLYERQGYREAARRDCVPGGWKTDTREWVLMTKSLD